MAILAKTSANRVKLTQTPRASQGVVAFVDSYPPRHLADL